MLPCFCNLYHMAGNDPAFPVLWWAQEAHGPSHKGTAEIEPCWCPLAVVNMLKLVLVM